MTDSLTQIQTCLDQLATQMYASLNYISTHHSSAPIPGQPFHGTLNTSLTQQAHGADSTQDPGADDAGRAAATDEFRPDSPTSFKAALQELAADLVAKEQQIEGLIDGLPGVGVKREDQEEKMRALERELVAMEGEMREARGVRDALVERVEGALMGLRRVWT